MPRKRFIRILISLFIPYVSLALFFSRFWYSRARPMTPVFRIARPGTNHLGCRQGTRADEGCAARNRRFTVIAYTYVVSPFFLSPSITFHLVSLHLVVRFIHYIPTRLDRSCIPFPFFCFHLPFCFCARVPQRDCVGQFFFFFLPILRISFRTQE